tara:strand:- start:355 stop:879 length:525 start_codon:yes stop_codon:yes gene_type:complete
MYNLKTTSLSSRFYSWIWNTEISKFKTMCPYFWSYVLTIILLPFLLVAKGLIKVLPESKKINKAVDYVAESKIFKPSRFWDVLGTIVKWIFFIFVGLILLALVYALVCITIEEPFEMLLAVGLGVGILAILILTVHLFYEYSLLSKIAHPFKLFGNMVYSLYKNVCPLIKWEEK